MMRLSHDQSLEPRPLSCSYCTLDLREVTFEELGAEHNML